MSALMAKPRKTYFSKQEPLFSHSFREKKSLLLESKLPYTLAVCLITIAFVFLVIKRLPPQVPIFYGLPKGEEQLTSRIGLIIPSLTSIAIILVNFALSQVLKDSYFRRILALASMGSTFFSTITTLKIIALVGSF